MIVAVDDDRLDKPLLVPGVVPKLSRTPGRVPPSGDRWERIPMRASSRDGRWRRSSARRAPTAVARRPEPPGPSSRASEPAGPCRASRRPDVPRPRDPIELGTTLHARAHLRAGPRSSSSNAVARRVERGRRDRAAVAALPRSTTSECRPSSTSRFRASGATSDRRRGRRRAPVHLIASTGFYIAAALPLYFQFHGPGQADRRPGRRSSSSSCGTSRRASAAPTIRAGDAEGRDRRGGHDPRRRARDDGGGRRPPADRGRRSRRTRIPPRGTASSSRRSFAATASPLDRVVIGHSGDTDDLDVPSGADGRGLDRRHGPVRHGARAAGRPPRRDRAWPCSASAMPTA